MNLGRLVRTIITGAAVLLLAGSAGVLAAPGAAAAPAQAGGLSLSVDITGGPGPIPLGGIDVAWDYGYNETITNSTGGPVTVTGGSPGDGWGVAPIPYGPAPGTVLQPGTSTFTGLGVEDVELITAPPPGPLVLTVDTTAGSVTWNQSTGTSTYVPVGAIGGLGLAALAGAALFVAQRRRRHRPAA